jgi:hypothetical protein
LLTGHLHDENGKFGAEHLAQATGHATLVVTHLGRMITLGIKKAGHLQGVAGTISHAQLTTLTTLNNEVDLAARHDDAIPIKRFTPKSHSCLLLTNLQ